MTETVSGLASVWTNLTNALACALRLHGCSSRLNQSLLKKKKKVTCRQNHEGPITQQGQKYKKQNFKKQCYHVGPICGPGLFNQ